VGETSGPKVPKNTGGKIHKMNSVVKQGRKGGKKKIQGGIVLVDSKVRGEKN